MPLTLQWYLGDYPGDTLTSTGTGDPLYDPKPWGRFSDGLPGNLTVTKDGVIIFDGTATAWEIDIGYPTALDSLWTIRGSRGGTLSDTQLVFVAVTDGNYYGYYGWDTEVANSKFWTALVGTVEA
jgi:hypothetical protein